MKDNIKESYRNNSKPLLTELLAILKLDKNYIRAEGDFLYYLYNNTEKRVLDLTGGYGSLLLGHNNPEIVQYIRELYSSKVPVHAQLSVRSGSAILSRRINDIISASSGKNYVCAFLNSGSEAVEAAIKHTYLNFNTKIKSFRLEQEKAFLNIKNYFQKYDVNFEFILNNKHYSNLQIFKKDIESSNDLRLKNYKHKILASRQSFHGKTIGALSLTSNSKLRDPFISKEQNRTIFFEWDIDEIQNHITQNEFVLDLPRISTKGKLMMKKVTLNSIVAIIVEPILGEGGVHIVPKDILTFLRTVATKSNIPLIFDEIQCGCYRTGEFLASFKSKVYADYYLMGKSLGGGISKISALIIDKKEYIPEFEMIHSSTNAEDDISSFVAIKALELAKREKQNIIEQGNYILRELKKIKKKYENVITDIRGDGLMIGISFKDFRLSQCYGFQGLSRSNYFGYILMGYLLNKKNIRVSVTLSDDNTIRIHPSLYVTKSSLDEFIMAIDELCHILVCNDLYSLVDYILEENLQGLRPVEYFDIEELKLDNDTNYKSQVGFLVHYIDPQSMRESIPSFFHLNDDTLVNLLRLLMSFAEPVLLGRNCIKNAYGDKVLMSFVGLPFTSKMVKDDLNASRYKILEYQKICNKAIDYLIEEGITTIGLGQFTSILLQNGKAINNSNITVTTGNSFTVYSALQVVSSEINKRGLFSNKIAVIGAGGNIASVISSLLINKCEYMLLVGSSENSEQKIINHAESLLKDVLLELLNNDISPSKLTSKFLNSNLLLRVTENRDFLNSGLLWEQYQLEFFNNPPIEITWDLNDLKESDITVVATNQGAPFLKSKYFKKNAFICDISVPSNCTDELLMNTDIRIERGGIVNLPNMEMLYPKGLPIEKGQAFACMCETMLLGFEQSEITYSFGELLKFQVQKIGELGEKHGFRHHKYVNDTIPQL
ncbi:aminotransferase class III-fold pyridoxal phosphate-dependent enzyme [Flavobacteriaceae bacterium S0862]|nr:aminotransferase class III-fold pyridoxal phosphate-dependent enzyme [Flavobacteriaceae bacterium S0862]